MLAVFFASVWPEPVSSAAGLRTRELMDILLEAGWSVACVSPATNHAFREQLEARGIRTLAADPNDSPATDALLAGLGAARLVVYDRFMLEEQFGWRARARWPEALHLVDTIDLHSLRRAREKLSLAGAPPAQVRAPASADLGDDLLRELSSLYRADGALVVSDFERDWLTGQHGMPPGQVHHLPFSTAADADPPGFARRAGFCFLGNFRHAPNLDAARLLVRDLWPRVREQLSGAGLHLYGAYPPAEISAHAGKNGITAHGPVDDHRAALARHRALLAPLRFGAGIKGKVLEAWGTGTPVVGSALAFEGMGESGLLADAPEDFAAACVRLERDEALWRATRDRGLARVHEAFSSERVRRDFLAIVERGLAELPKSRERNLTGRLLRHQSQNSTKYFSRWIEAKSAKNTP